MGAVAAFADSTHPPSFTEPNRYFQSVSTYHARIALSLPVPRRNYALRPAFPVLLRLRVCNTLLHDSVNIAPSRMGSPSSEAGSYDSADASRQAGPFVRICGLSALCCNKALSWPADEHVPSQHPFAGITLQMISLIGKPLAERVPLPRS